MTKYQITADYVAVDYLNDLLEDWAIACDGDEWGELMISIHRLLRRAISCSDYEKAAVAASWLLEEIDRAYAEDWWGTKYDAYVDWTLIYEAQDKYEKITTYWRDRAAYFDKAELLEAVIAGLPEWIKPGENRFDPPNYEYENYLKLKAKYENVTG